ncbi:hypothetical protein [Psychrobacillus sp. OK028]|uniref:hypothetical protein n=1 Tax=Psychrobacillus sp. OK028 TaxID=1884359 RepID=UPI0015875B7C|nr:hypothetical protein [Psychrobacillus sp. OK028]
METLTALLPGLLFLFYFVPVIFIIWFMVTLVKQMKVQTKLLEQIHEKLNSSE